MKDLIDKVKTIFADESLDVVIGFERGSLPLRGTPRFFETVEDLDNLIFDATCNNILAKYLAGEKKRPGGPRKIGIIAKGCDARAIAQMVVEDQFPREKLVIIGISCGGVFNTSKIRKALAGRIPDGYRTEQDVVIITGNGFEITLPRNEIFQNNCLTCQHPNAPQRDYFIGEAAEPIGAKAHFAEVEELAAKTPDERWAYFTKEYSACIRCYACRNACPLCYCEECFVDRINPKWVGKGTDISDNFLYHIVRTLHLAGRCVDCGACATACPLDIDVRILGKRVEKEILERFGYVAGLDFETPPALAAFREDDKEEFIM
jgi:ferredoxin